LPTESPVSERLSDLQKARVAEAFRLRQIVGDAVWPGWGQADIPVIVYNELYAFLVGYLNPPSGWVKVPQNEQRGGLWEPVLDDSLQNETYYRQTLPDPDVTPENFTVLVGDRWVATLQTKEYSFVAFVNGFREETPAVLRPIIPYRLIWRFLGGDTEVYLGALAHESFHAYQGTVAATRLAQAERVAWMEGQYPWTDDVAEAAWQRELNVLARAAQVESDGEAAELARQFLALRQERRQRSGLTPELVDFERQREWLEGLAKYAELSIVRQAAETPDYEPVLALVEDPDFENYAGSRRFWDQQLGEVTRMTNRSGEVRFYYSGFAQAVLLDRLLPGWKSQVVAQGVFLEDLLGAAVADFMLLRAPEGEVNSDKLHERQKQFAHAARSCRIRD
jgi:hypothetical protein